MRKEPAAAAPKSSKTAARAPVARQRQRGDRAIRTRERILEAALQDFSERGLHGASLRSISERSEVPLSALHYHFGSKEDLFAAAVEQIFARLSAERLALLAKVEAAPEKITVEAILHALIAPVLTLAGGPLGVAYAMLQSRLYDAREASDRMLTGVVLPATAPFRRALHKVLPDVPNDHLVRGYRSIVRDISNVAIDPAFELLTGKPSLPKQAKGVEELAEFLVRYHAAGLRALRRPASAKPAPTRRRKH
ncbi:MAG: TetR family transcriptional regulator [Rhodospirillales bacterium]|jgi:AcrR family transcriptional regulator|nr:TetR family transcriptional regulator [Rhodospirillales bacterium]